MPQESAEVTQRIQNALDRADLDGMILASQFNTYYAAGHDVLISRLLPERRTFVVVPRLGQSTVVVYKRDQDATRLESPIEDVRPYPGRLAVPIVAEAVREKGLDSSRLGIEEASLRTVDYKELTALLPQAEFVPCDELMREVRSIKTTKEIELLRHAAVCTEKAIYATFSMARPGITERDMADQLVSNLHSLGAVVTYPPLLTAGFNSTVPHILPSDKRIMHGEVVHIDVSGFWSWYPSDISRNAVVGQPTPEQRSNYHRLWEMHQTLFAEMRVGTRASDLYRMYQDLSKQQGFAQPTAGLGHGLGLEGHELPELDLDNDTQLQTCMVLALEPQTTVPGDARYHIEDTVLVTEEGPELLSAWRSSEDMPLI